MEYDCHWSLSRSRVCTVHLVAMITTLTLLCGSCNCEPDPVAALVPLISRNSRDDVTRRQERAGCSFGDEFYELQQSWHPVLEPAGLMVCVICTCHPVFRRGRLSTDGSIECQNIAPSCPTLDCPRPRKQPGQCCKICASPVYTPHDDDVIESAETNVIESDYAHEDMTASSRKIYIALMSGRSRLFRVRTRAVGSARISIIDARDVTFSIELVKLNEPRSVRFTDEHGTVLHDVMVSDSAGRTSEAQDITSTSSHGGKTWTLCGTWRDVSAIYRGYIEQSKLYIVMTTADRRDGEISGVIRSHGRTREEIFHSVLTPSERTGDGAIALVSYEAASGALVISLLHEGVADRRRDVNASLVIRRKNRSIYHAFFSVRSQGFESSQVWLNPAARHVKSLLRGRLQLALVWGRRNALRGDIASRLTCKVFHAILTPAPTDGRPSNRRLSNGAASRARHRSAGDAAADVTTTSLYGAVVTLMVTEKGKIQVTLLVNGVSERVLKDGSELVVSEVTKHSSKPLCSISSGLQRTRRTCGNAQLRHLPSLYRGELQVTLTTRRHDVIDVTTLTGLVQEVTYNPNSFRTGYDVIMTGADDTPPLTTSWAIGHAWLAVSLPKTGAGACTLHYSISLKVSNTRGASRQVSAPRTYTPYARDGISGQIYTASAFTGSEIHGVFTDLPVEFYRHLALNRVVLGVRRSENLNHESQRDVLVANISIPNECAAAMHDASEDDVTSREESITIDLNPVDDAEGTITPNQCIYNGMAHADGETWLPSGAPCSTCSCSRGVTQCQEVICPPVSCSRPVRLSGDCCDHCPVYDDAGRDVISTKSCYFAGDLRHHVHGSVFHPYLVPFGYQRCAVCACVDGDDVNDVICAHLPCPELSCDVSEAVRRHTNDCCKQCPDVINVRDDEGGGASVDLYSYLMSVQTRCKYGGQTYEDGDQWHPRQPGSSHQLEHCVTCTCHAGRASCVRQQCEQLSCERRVTTEGTCCPRCDGS